MDVLWHKRTENGTLLFRDLFHYHEKYVCMFRFHSNQPSPNILRTLGKYDCPWDEKKGTRQRYLCKKVVFMTVQE